MQLLLRHNAAFIVNKPMFRACALSSSSVPHRSLTEASPIAYRLTPRGDFGEQQNLGEEPRSVTEGSADITVHRTDVPKPLSGSVYGPSS